MTDHPEICVFCGCCLTTECQQRPCPEWVELRTEITDAPTIHWPAKETTRVQAIR